MAVLRNLPPKNASRLAFGTGGFVVPLNVWSAGFFSTPAERVRSAEISTSTGAVVPAFGHNANGRVDTLASYKTHLLVGGYYTSVNGSSADPYYEMVPANIVKAIKEGRLTRHEEPFARVLFQHSRRHERHSDKAKRITFEQVGAELSCSRDSAKRAIRRMVGAGELVIESPGKGRGAGAIYRFPGRS